MPKEKKEIGNLANYGSEQLVKDAGSLSFFNPLGTKDDVDEVIQEGGVHAGLGVSNAGIPVPGICVLDYAIVPGRSTDGTSGLNIAAKKLYTFVRHANSGHANYDSPDLMNFAFSGVSLFTFIVECQRAYGVMNKYSARNRYLGKLLTEALGFDYENIVSDLAGFRSLINVAALKLNAIKIPDAWPLWSKNYMLNAALLKDGEIDRSQIYAFRSNTIWQYNETGTYVGSLTPYLPFENGLLKTSDVKTIIDTIVNAFVASEDINIMSGDIVKAYGDDHCLELSLLDDGTIVTPIYNREMLEIMHNATVYPVDIDHFTTNSGYIIYQDTSTNTLLFDPNIYNWGVSIAFTDNKDESVVLSVADKEYIDLMRDDVTPKDVVNASIMTNVAFKPNSGYTAGKFSNFGTELACKCTLYYIDELGNSNTVTAYRMEECATLTTISGSPNTIALLFRRGSCLSKFDWHPRVTTLIGQDSGNMGNGFSAYALRHYDLYNYTVVSSVELQRLHDLHVLGGFGLAD